MSRHPEGPGRRLTEDDEARGAELFAAGKSEREVADELDCSASTAHRLRERLQCAQDGPELTGRVPLPGGLPVLHMRLNEGGGVDLVDPAEGVAQEVEDAMRAEVLAQLRQVRDDAASVVADLEARAEASRQAIMALDAERLELLAAGRDAAPLRPRRADAVADLADAETAIGMARQPVGDAEARVAEAEAEIAAIEAERIRQEAVKLGARLAPKAAAAMRAAVLGDGTVRALADLASQLARAEAVAGQSWDGEIVPPALPGAARDEWHRAVCDLWQVARRGDVATCQAVIPRCVPWTDRDPGEIARMRDEVQANAARLFQLGHENAARVRAGTRVGQGW
jgi:hypothetical protein